MDEQLLRKYIKNELKEEELYKVLSEFRDIKQENGIKVILHNFWEEIYDKDSVPDVDFESVLNKIHHQINLMKSKTLVENNVKSLLRYKRINNFIRIVRNVAAIMLVPVLGFVFFLLIKNPLAKQQRISYNLAYNEVFSSTDAITKVTLPDGSNVWLNHNSSLKYPATFMGNSRIVELIGEGFFDIVHNPEIPFIVETGGIQVMATGTTFNVMTYPDEDKIETSLISGSVDLFKSENGHDGMPLVRMIPGNMVIFNKANKQIFTKTFTDDSNFSWKNGKLKFTAEPMETVVKKLSKWFNADFQIKDPQLLELTLTATFIHETLPEVLELLSLLSPLEYSISTRVENPDGTFTRRKVELIKKKI
jgi:ferric-dicitrate binding protein FerR (iron transport regulator)